MLPPPLSVRVGVVTAPPNCFALVSSKEIVAVVHAFLIFYLWLNVRVGL